MTLPALAAFAAAPVCADTVTLGNGDRLSGTVVKMEAGTLWLETAYAGTLKLPWPQVYRLETDGPVRLKLDDRAEFDVRLQPGAARQVRVRPGGVGEPAPLPLDRIVAINPPRDPGRTALRGRAALRYEQGWWGNRLRLFHTSELLLRLEAIEDYLLQTRTGFRVPVGNGMSLGARGNVDYDAVPAAGKDSTDTALSFKDYTS